MSSLEAIAATDPHLTIAVCGTNTVSISRMSPENTGNVYHLIASADAMGLRWADAAESALRLGGHLVTLDDSQEVEWLREAFPDVIAWTGLFRSGDSFRWQSGSGADFRPWDADQAPPVGSDLVAVSTLSTTPAWISTNLATTRVGDTEIQGIVEVPAARVTLRADISGDRRIDQTDLQMLATMIRSSTAPATLDLNLDGIVNQADLQYFVRETLGTVAGDANLDGTVGFGDFLLLSQHFGQTEVNWDQGDFDGNNSVDFADFLSLSSNFGFMTTKTRYLRFRALSEVNQNPWATIGELNAFLSSGELADKSLWSLVSVSSEEVDAELAPAIFAFDGANDTFWHSTWAPEGTGLDPHHPHELVIDLGALLEIANIQYVPRQDLQNGRVADFAIYTGIHAIHTTTPFATGTFVNETAAQYAKDPGIPPTAADVVFSTNEDIAVPLDLRSAAQDPDTTQDRLFATIVEGPEHGSLERKSSGSFLYIPHQDYWGTDRFTYLVADGVHQSNIAQATMQVHAVPDAPFVDVIPDVVVNASEGLIKLPILIADADGDPLEVVGYGTAPNPLAEIRDTYGLVHAGDDYFNLTGLQEKWLFGSDNTAFMLLPTGDLVQWWGTYASTGVRESLIARLDESVYQDPSLLWNADSEVVVPMAVHVDMSMSPEGHASVVAVPDQGLFGDVTVHIVASDGETRKSQQFQFTIQPDQGAHQRERQVVNELRIFATDLSYDDIPVFVENAEANLATMSMTAQLELSELLTTLKSWYGAAQNNIVEAQRYRDGITANSVERIAEFESLLAPLERLRQDYEQEWSAYLTRRNTPSEANVNMPPVFIHGNLPSEPIQVYQGEAIHLDLQAVHPQGVGLYSYQIDFAKTPGWFRNDFSAGAFTWEVPATAPGVYNFTITANGGDGRDKLSTLPFSIEVLPNAPSVASLTIDSKVVSDSGTEPIRLSANQVTHPNQLDDVVIRYYQDMDNNQAFDPFIDQFLGSSAVDESWIGTPFPTTQDEVTFLAIAYLEVESKREVFSHGFFYDFGEEVASKPVSVTVPVFKTPVRETSPLTPVLFTVNGVAGPTQTYETMVVPITSYLTPRLIATYGDHRSAVLSQDGSSSLRIQRYQNANGLGIGTAVGSPIKVAEYGGDVAVVSDAEGNLTIAFSTGNFGGTNPDGSPGSALWLMKVDTNNSVSIAPVKLAAIDDSEGFSFTLDVNDVGDGIIAWKGFYSTSSVHMQTFVNGGETLGTVHELPFPGGFHDGGDWRSVAINNAGRYLLNFGGYDSGSAINVTGNVHSASPPDVVPVTMFAREATMNSQGWTVLTNGSEMQVFGLDGRAIGLPFPIPGPTGFRRIFDLRYTNDQTIELYSERSTMYTLQAFSLASHPGLSVVDTMLPPELTLHAGDTVDVQFSLSNASPGPYTATDVVFYLSHNAQFESADRQIGIIEITDGIAAAETKTFSGSVTLPVNFDPFWSQGTEGLTLIAAIPSSGSVHGEPIQAVATVPSNPATTGPPVSPVPYRQRAPFPAIDWIRRDVVPQQYASYLSSDAFVELIGYQYLAALHEVEREATIGKPFYFQLPSELTGPISSLRNQIETSLEAFNLKRYNLQFDRDAAIVRLDNIRALALQSAEGERDAQQQQAEAFKTQLVSQQNTIIQSTRGSLEGRVRREESRIRSQIEREEGRVRGLLESASQTDSDIREVLKKLFPDPRKLTDLRALAKHFRDQAKTIQEAVQRLKDDLQNVRNEVQKDIDQEILYAREQIAWAERYATLISVQAKRDYTTAKEDIESDYRQAKATVDTTQQSDLANTVSKSVVPTLSGAVNSHHNILNGGKAAIQQIQQDAKALDEQNPFGSVQENIDTAMVSAEIAQGVLTQLNEKLAPVIDTLKQTGGKFSDWGKDTGGKASDWTKESGQDVAEWAKTQIDDALDEEVIAFKGVTDFDMSLNLSNGAFYLDAKVGPGVGYDSRKLNELLESGSVSIPDIDPVDAIKKVFSARIEQVDDYDEVRDSLYQNFGGQNVYFSSRRFVDHFGAESAAEIVVETILFGGAAAAKDAIADIGEHLRLELNDILGWLEQRGEAQIEALVPELVRALLTGQNFRSPHVELQWKPIQYEYRLKPEPILGKAVAAVTGNETLLDDFVDKTQQDSRHAGFAIIWQIPDPGNPYDNFAAYWNDLDVGSFQGEVLTPERIAKSFQVLINENLPENLKLSGEAIDILEALGPILGEVGKFEKQLAKVITDVLNFDAAEINAKIQELKKLQNGGFKLDFRGTPASQRLEAFLKKITFGNRRQAEITEFSFELTTFTLTIKGTLCHKHSWGSIGDIVEGLQTKIA